MKYLFRGGTVVSGRGTRRADILVEGEKIVEVGRNITRKADQIIDVTGMLLMPGFIDAHTHFDLDVCAFPHNAKCPAYFTKEDDGLAREWGNRTCWMNPPYGKAIKAWMTKALDASRRGATVVCLVPSRTDTAWWHDTVLAGGAEVRFVRGRLRFVGAEHPAPFPSAVVIFRPPPSPSQQKETNDENNNPQ